MPQLPGHQKKFLRGAAHALKAVVTVGQRGLTPAVVEALDAALERHELVKVKFTGIKDRDRKGRLADEMAAAGQASLAGLIGHTAILYRRHPDPEKRRIVLPDRKGKASEESG